MRTRTAASVAALALTLGVLSAAPSSAAPSSAGPSSAGPASVDNSGEGGLSVERGPGLRASGGPVATVAAANVRAGSIVFTRGGNVWLVRGDGSGLYQVTRDGGYKQPSMSSNGTIVAVKGGNFVLMRQNGAVLRSFRASDLFPPDSSTTAQGSPAMPMISPDGTRIAYYQTRVRNVAGRIVVDSAYSVTSSSRPTVSTINRGTDPMWITNNRVLATDGAVWLGNVGATSANWYGSDDIHPNYDHEWQYYDILSTGVSPNAKYTANNVMGLEVAIAAVTGDPRTSIPQPPQVICFVNDANASGEYYSRTTFSPDSTSIAVAAKGKLSVIKNIAACNATSTEKVVATGATDPFWSAAALNPPKRPVVKPPKKKAFKLTKRSRVVGKAWVGRRLTVSAAGWSPRPSRTMYRWYRGSRPIGGAAGAKRVYTLRKADQGKRLRVKVTAARKGYVTKSAWSTSSQTVKRRR